MASLNLFRRRTVEKTTLTPPAIDQAYQAQGMDASTQFGPGRPLNPAWGYSQRPRAVDYPTGVNINIRNRQAWGRASFDTLRTLVDVYDVARICINHKIDELRSMEPLFQPAEGVHGDVDTAITAARAVLAFPDRELPFDAWLAKLLENTLRYDATPLYKRRNYDGDIIGYEVVDGPTIFPLIDGHGRRPRPPAAAFQQVIRGVPSVDYTTDDLDYLVFRPQPGNPFGVAPLESILLTANTDLRFQWHFLQMFTDGNVPAGFMEVPPDVTSPDQVAEWQDYWDAIVMGDQAKLHQLIAVPAGTKVTETKPGAFDSAFPEYLMTRTCAAYGVVPQDIGLIKDVNRANSETQVDIQFRVNTLPWVRWVEGILTRYLSALGLPVQIKLDTGRDKEDRLTEANAWKVYIESGIASPDEARTELLGLPIDNQRPVPRGIISSRLGFVPLVAVEAISGPVDPETAAPVDDAPIPVETFDGTPSLLPYKPPGGQEFKRAPFDPDEPNFPSLEKPMPGTGIENPAVPKTVHASSDRIAKAVEDERAAFTRFLRARVKGGRWRDFRFAAVPAREARELNKQGRALVRKDAGQPVAAGLAVQAQDTGRVLMLQRGLDPGDANAGTWEFPGGHLEDGETAKQAAYREWQEETGRLLPYVPESPDLSWTSADGVYQGFLWVVPDESVCVPGERGTVVNPDDPDGDVVEAVAWWDPAQLPGNPAIRPELAASIDQVLAVLEDPGPLVKAGDARPKASWRSSAADTPHARFDLAITDHYQPQIVAALQGLFTETQLHKAITAARELTVRKAASGEQVAAAAAATSALTQADTRRLEQVIAAILAEAWVTGGHAASLQLGDGTVTLASTDLAGIDWSTWTPGHLPAAALAADGGLQALLEDAGIRVDEITETTVRRIGDAIAEGLANGQNTATVMQALLGVVGDVSRAEMIAHTETARAMTQATLATYQANQISQWELVTSPGACPICMGVQAGGPYPSSDSADAPPVHPRCRCAASPVTGG